MLFLETFFCYLRLLLVHLFVLWNKTNNIIPDKFRWFMCWHTDNFYCVCLVHLLVWCVKNLLAHNYQTYMLYNFLFLGRAARAVDRLKGSQMMMVCQDCKMMVLQIIKSARANRSAIRNKTIQNLTLNLSPVF